MYTVKKLARLAGVSARTLHYYDEIGLLRPALYGGNSYRYYDEQGLLRLQQILFFKELDLSLDEIRAILDQPDFDVLHALRSHREALQGRMAQLNQLIRTVDKTIRHLQGEIEMQGQEYYEGFNPEKQKEYEQEIREKYGPENVDESIRRMNSYSAEEKKALFAHGEELMQAFVAHIGQDVASPAVQELAAQWHRYIHRFYNCSYEILYGLGQMYAEHPEFRATFDKRHPELAEFMRQAISHYCEGHSGLPAA